MKKSAAVLASLALFITAQACNTHHAVEVAPMEIKPIHITIDVVIRVDKALENYFEDIDQAATRLEEKIPPAKENQ